MSAVEGEPDWDDQDAWTAWYEADPEARRDRFQERVAVAIREHFEKTGEAL